jgi:LacI family transcriptional regulator
MAKSRPTISHLAERAKVSAMTVSRALRGQPGVSERVACRIRRLAEAMDYRPNPLVQALMSQMRAGRVKSEANVIGLLLPQFDDPNWGRQEWIRRGIHGARERAQEAGFRLELFKWQTKQMSDERMDQILKARGIRGIVIAPLPRPGDDLHLDWNHYAAAAIGATMGAPRLHRVRHHAYNSAQLAVAKLRAAGRRRIGFALATETAARVDHMWEAGFLVATTASGKAPLLHKSTSFNRSEFLHWYRRVRPDALIMPDNRCYTWLCEEGIAVPGEVAVAHLNRYSQPVEMSGIDQEFEVVGAATVDLVIEQCSRGEFGIPSRPKDVLMEGVWVQGRTAGTAAPSARRMPKSRRASGK